MIRRLLTLLTLLALVASLSAGVSTAAHACSCVDLTAAEAVAKAKVVFTGTVVEARAGEPRPAVFASSVTSGLTGPVPGVTLSSSLCSGNVPVAPGAGPLKPGDERRTGQEVVTDPVDSALVAALGAPVRAGERPRSRNTRPGGAAHRCVGSDRGRLGAPRT